MPKEFIEMEIPVPYGSIKAKAWGSASTHSHQILGDLLYELFNELI